MKLWPEQAEVFWSDAPSIIFAGGEGSGKSFVSALWAFCLALTSPSARLVWIVGEDFEDARREMDYIMGGVDCEGFAVQLGVLDRDHSTISTHADQKVTARIYAPATLYEPAIDVQFTTVSGYDWRKIGRDQPDIIVGSEISRWDVELWRRCQGRLARLKHARGMFSGSFETSEGWFPEVFSLGQAANTQGVASFSVPSSANRTLYPLGPEDPAILRLRQSMHEERFLARHEGRPAAPRDAVLPEFKALLHIQPTEYTPGYPVYIFIDPGTKVYAVLFVQIVEENVRVLNEVYLGGPSHAQVIAAAMMRPEWQFVREGIIDVAGGQHHFGEGSPEETWYRDTGLRLRAQYRKIEDTIDRLRTVLSINPATQRPYLSISPRCKGLIAEFGGGPSPVQGGGRWRNGSTGHPKAENDHAIKALGYGLLAMFGTTKPYRNDEEDETVETYLVAPRRSMADLLHRQNTNTARTSLSTLLR